MSAFCCFFLNVGNLLLTYKKLQACKPDSVMDYHLSVPAIACRDPSAYPVSCHCKMGPWTSSPPPNHRSDTIRGISACKVYPRIMLPLQAVSSYLTFSPFHPPLLHLVEKG